MKALSLFLFLLCISFFVMAQRAVQLHADGGLAIGNYAGWTGLAGISLDNGILLSFQYDDLKRETKSALIAIIPTNSFSEPQPRPVRVYSAVKAYSIIGGKSFDLTGSDEFILSFEGGVSALQNTLPSDWRRLTNSSGSTSYYLDYDEIWTAGFITRIKLLMPITSWSGFFLSTTCNMNSQSTYAFVSAGLSLNTP